MIPEQIFDFIKEKLAGKRVEAFDLFLQSKRETQIEAKEGAISLFQEAHPQGAGLRVFRKEADGWRVGFSSASVWEPKALEKMTSFATDSLDFLESDPLNGPPELADISPAFEEADPLLLSRTPQGKKEKMDVALQLEAKAKNFHPQISRVRQASYGEEIFENFLFSSQGKPRSYQKTLCEISLMVMAEDEKGQESSWDSEFAIHFGDLPVARLAEETALQALSLLGGRSIPTERLPILLDRSVAASFLGMLAPSFLAENVQKQKSFLVGKKIGKEADKIYSDQLLVVDDGLLPGGFVSAPFDGEGVLRQRTNVIHNGVPQALLYDSYTARRDQVSSTGNSSRSSFRTPCSPTVSNFFIPAGGQNREEMLRQIGRGFLVTDVIGMHTVNPVSGDFSVGASGFMIEQGEKKFPVRGVAIAGNLHEMFSKLKARGDDLKFYHSIGAPSLWIESLQVSGGVS
ncbi:MAG: TldD/PmbA family protein [bacterium]|nr:TldD/PmbA family protein [bacterium]